MVIHDSQIPQQTSVGCLAISEVGLRILLTAINVFPPFLDVLHTFGWKESQDANQTLCYEEHINDQRGTEGQSLTASGDTMLI